MNPLILLALGGVALMAMTGKKRNGAKEEEDAGPPLPDVEPDDQIVEEGAVESAMGLVYESRIWRVYEAAADYMGELFLEEEDAWVSGPMADDLPTVRAGLQEMANSFDPEMGDPLHWEPEEPCANALPGPYQAMGFDPVAGEWQPFPGGGMFTAYDQPQTGMRWCVVSYVEGGLSYLEGRVTDEQGNLIYATGPETDPNVAASKAGYVALQGLGDLPWPQTGGVHTQP
jgi:hypothetical protein